MVHSHRVAVHKQFQDTGQEARTCDFPSLGTLRASKGIISIYWIQKGGKAQYGA